MGLRTEIFVFMTLYVVRRASCLSGQMAIEKSFEVVKESSGSGKDCKKRESKR
jgi:hypothetical protein